MADPTIVTSAVTGTGVLLAAFVTQLIGGRQERKRSDREDARLEAERKDRIEAERRADARLDAERGEALAKERREAKREAYTDLAASVTEVAHALRSYSVAIYGGLKRKRSITAQTWQQT